MPIVKLSSTRFKVNLGFLSIETNWEINEIQKHAAWEMYVELATRTATNKLSKDEGLLRETLTSLHSLFAITRDILKKYGSLIATPENTGDITFGHLAISVLNKVLRPTLAKWHPILLDWEQQKPIKKSSTEHESQWEFNDKLREELNVVRLKLIEYANVLGEVSEVSNLIGKE
ncbi:hypothetical protein Q4Q35_20135 [Flavivirga aquimarina]|uniref:Uncharacterized protein n=1 Tax=Flavivirga aquimarina TaxID=2027862 RepID=A0ABT8WG40_9FLAO|nr:hypothetical protein [Flavivirga aquimarina]MDO5972115.1 hypothetical protein [Flavivirga aquimarina]